MVKVVYIHDERVVDIESPCGDIAAHTITANSAGTDLVRFVLNDVWNGYDHYSVVFYRDDLDTPDKEYALDIKDPKCYIPASLCKEPGMLRFSVKALDYKNTVRRITQESNAYFVVVASGRVDGTVTDDQFTEVEQLIKDAQGLAGQIEELKQVADDMVSPTVEVEPVEDGSLVTITDKNGEHEFTVKNGERGERGEQGDRGEQGLPGVNGVSPNIGVDVIENGHKVTVNDAAGTHSFDVFNGAKGDKGDQGDKGDKGDKGDRGEQGLPGVNGVSPKVDVESIAGGHKVTITDADGEKDFDVMDGETPEVALATTDSQGLMPALSGKDTDVLNGLGEWLDASEFGGSGGDGIHLNSINGNVSIRNFPASSYRVPEKAVFDIYGVGSMDNPVIPFVYVSIENENQTTLGIPGWPNDADAKALKRGSQAAYALNIYHPKFGITDTASGGKKLTITYKSQNYELEVPAANGASLTYEDNRTVMKSEDEVQGSVSGSVQAGSQMGSLKPGATKPGTSSDVVIDEDIQTNAVDEYTQQQIAAIVAAMLKDDGTSESVEKNASIVVSDKLKADIAEMVKAQLLQEAEEGDVKSADVLGKLDK